MNISPSSKPKVLVIFGTRPEAIKLFPVVRVLSARKNIETLTCVTAQHREMLDQVLTIADIVRDRDILQLARNYALKILKEDAPMQKPENAVLRAVYIELTKKKNIWNYIS